MKIHVFALLPFQFFLGSEMAGLVENIEYGRAVKKEAGSTRETIRDDDPDPG